MADLTNDITPKVSYSRVIQQPMFPTRDQAIVIDSIDGITIQEYIVELQKFTEPQNIRFVSRISNSRVCIYLNTKDNADKLIENKTKITIGSHILEIRPLISRAKRIILSNVCPIIPHQVIIQELEKINIRPTSQMLFIRAGLTESGLSHVLSFRRQLYIEPDDVSKLPASMKISFDGTDFWIYLSTDKVVCFACKEEGHVIKFCPKENANKPQDSPIMSLDEKQKQQFPPLATGKSTTEKNDGGNISTEMLPPPQLGKRQHPASTSSSSTTTEVNLNFNAKEDNDVTKQTRINKKLPKKLPKIKSHEISRDIIMLQMEPAKEIFENSNKNYPLDYNKTIEFLHTSFGKHDIYNIASNYTTDTAALVLLLTDVQQKAVDLKLQRRLDKIKKRLQNPNCNDSLSESNSEAENDK